MSLSPTPNSLSPTTTTTNSTTTTTISSQPPASPIILDSPRTPVNELNLNKFLVLSKSNSSLSNSSSSQSSQPQSNGGAPNSDADLNMSMNINDDDEKSIAALKETLSSLLTRESTPNSTHAHPHFESTFSFRSNFSSISYV